MSSDGPYLASGSEVTVGVSVDLLDTSSRVMGDSVFLKDNAAVHDVYYNELDGLGDVFGNHHTPVALPLVSAFPELPIFSPGTLDFDVPQGGAQTIGEGSYGLLKARKNSTITFTGGSYDFSEWDVGLTVDLFFEAPSEIRIAGRLAVDKNSTLGPAAGSGLDATGIVIYVNGINGRSGRLYSAPKAAKFGLATVVHANVYAPNGTVWLRKNGQFTGAFLGKWVTLGKGASARHLSQWTEGTGGTASALGGGAALASLTPGTSFTSAIDASSTLAAAGEPSGEAPVLSDAEGLALALSAADPLMALLAPFAFVVIVPFARRRRTQEFSVVLVILVIIAGAGLAFAAIAVPGSSAEAMSLPTNGLESIGNAAPASDSGLASRQQQGGLQTTTIDYAYDPLYRLTAADYDTGEFFHYAYDAVGNRLTQDTLAGANTYAYDIANRLTSVDGVPYAWDAKGNLLDDDTRSYSYDHANRLASVVMGADSFTYAYNGLGDRLQQTVNSVPQNYTLDLAAGLTQVLQDGTNSYLYGVGRIGEERPGGFVYHVGDALGSVQQLLNGSAAVTLARRYEPFGKTLTSTGDAETVFQFTGEQRDGSDLMYLRARYLSTSLGRFITKDIAGMNPEIPVSGNAWLYVYANPINRTDPTGQTPPAPTDHRNLTDWLVREMQANAMSPEILEIAKNNKNAANLLERPFAQPFAVLFKGFAYRDFKNLVQDGARWDFKDAIRFELRGETIALCHSNGCEWYEFSVPGNIHYGYIGRAVGFSEIELHYGASVAEVTDDDYRDLAETIGTWFVNLHINLECQIPLNFDRYVNFEWWRTGFDSPGDYAAIELGMDLYNTGEHPANLNTFSALLSSHSSSLDHMPDPVVSFSHEKWPYPIGSFDGDK